MKQIEIDDELYRYIASQTQFIGESASQILRRLLLGQPNAEVPAETPSQSSSSSLESLIEQRQPQQYNSAVKRFLQILACLHDYHADSFARVLQLKGRNRMYFATDKEPLLQSGSSTNPKQIPDSPYWVITNNNTSKKVTMLTQVMQILGHSDEEITTICQLFNPA